MSLCIVSGVTALAGPGPGSVSALLPSLVVYAWNLILILGSAAALIGLLRPGLRRLEVLGLVWLGTASIVYGATIGLRFGWSGLIAAGIVFGFGLAALFRALAVFVSYEIARKVTEE